MKAVIAGGSGFIGGHVIEAFARAGYEVVCLSRSDSKCGQARTVQWDSRSLGPWTEELEGAAVVINLSGKSITSRLTEANKKEILDSRVRTTELIAKAIVQCKNPPSTWINASAMGYYGDRGDELLTEESVPGDDFFAHVAQQWEEPVVRYDLPQTRKVRIRIGVVLGPDGGALRPMVLATKLFVGGSMGSGKQWLSWIHVDDLTSIMLWAVEAEREGVYNGVAPEPVTNGEMMAALRKRLHRPWSPPAPAMLLRLVGKVMTPDPSLSLISTRVVPQRSLEEGFRFKYPNLDVALDSLLA